MIMEYCLEAVLMIKSKTRYMCITTLFALSLSCIGCGKNEYKSALEYANDEKYDDAIVHFEKAIKENSEKAEYYIDYGFTYLRMSEYSEAITQFNKAILSSGDAIVEPNNKITRTNNKKAYRGKGIAYFEKHDYDNAIMMFENSLSIEELPELNNDIRAYLADSLCAGGRYDEAIEIYEQLIDNSTDKADSYYGIASCYSSKGDQKKAIDYYEKAIEENAENYSYYIGEYNAYLLNNDVEKAYQTLEGALSIKDTSDTATLYKGEIYYMTGTLDKAKENLEVARELGFDEATYFLAKICKENEDIDGAITYYEEYVSSKEGKTSALAVKELVGLYLCTKEYDSAQKLNDYGMSLNNAAFTQSFRYYEIVILESKGDFEGALDKVLNYCSDYPKDENMKNELVFLNTRVSK